VTGTSPPIIGTRTWLRTAGTSQRAPTHYSQEVAESFSLLCHQDSRLETGARRRPTFAMVRDLCELDEMNERDIFRTDEPACQ